MSDRLTSSLARKYQLLRVLLALTVVLSNSVAILTPATATQAAAQTVDDESFARQQLAGRTVRTGNVVDTAELQLAEIKKSLSGTHVRFQQRVNGRRVVNAQVTVHFDGNRQNVQVTGSFHQAASQMAAVSTTVDEAAAIAAARNAVGVKGALRGPVLAERVVYPLPGGAVPAWEVLIPASEPLGDWLVIVDATSGKILDKKNRLRQQTVPGAQPMQSIKLPPPMSRSAPAGGPPGGASVRQAEPATGAIQGQEKELPPAPPHDGPKQVPGGAVSVPPEKAARGIVDGQAAGQAEVVETTARALPRPLTAPPSQPVHPATGLLAESFEGAFPASGWTVFDNDGATNGDLFWDDEAFQPSTGSWSGWPAGGGANGLDPHTHFYANNMHSWMVYGPVNLSGATLGSLDFALWAQTEQNLDWITWAVSIDGQQFYGQRMSGSTTSSEPPTRTGFTQRSLDLTNVFTLGNVMGQSQVWIAFIFDTDSSIVDDGPFIDNIRLLISNGGSCTPNTSATAAAADDKRNPPATVTPRGPKSAPPGPTTPVPGKPPVALDGSSSTSGPTVQAAEARPARPPKRTGAQPPTASERSAVVQSQNFEGAFPSADWWVWDDNGPANGEYTWDDVSSQPHNGSWSAWTANGGLDALDPSLCMYPNNQNAWMTYGPVDLSTATAGSLNFWLWAQTEQNWDWVYWLVSVDGQNYYGQRLSGATTSTEPPTTSGWTQQMLDLAAVPTLGSALGHQNVWIGFVFTSDGTVVNDGAFIDDIVLDVTSGGGPPCTGGPASGSGLSFRPNPIASSGETTLVDNDDADSPALNDKRVSVQLQGLDGSGQLRGTYADLTATGITGGYRLAGQACSADGVHNYPRSDDRFEEVVVYYHVDASQRYIQSLGFTNVNNRSTPAHAHFGFAYQGGPNAFYSPANGGLHFFDIFVDIAEDGEVVVHEYGHAVLDNVIPTLWSDESGGLHEGFADYLAGTLLDQYNVSAQKLCLAEWFATDFSAPCLRRLDSTKHYPEDLQNQPHADGEIWSASLWQIRNALGATTADRVILEGLFYTDDRGMFADAANGILQADQALNGGANQNTIRNIFVNRGILTAQTFGLTVSTVGSGTVTGTGISCGADCTESYPGGTSVTLTATPASGWSYVWSGDCSGSASCVVTMSQARSVTATFTQATYLLTVTKSGNGTVTATGINCGADCTESYPSGTMVTLTATPANNWSFTGWTGACTGWGTCQVPMNAAKSVSATFQDVDVGVAVSRPPGLPPSGGPTLVATLTARPGCGTIKHIQFGDSGVSFDNARVTVISPGDGPPVQTSGFTYTPVPGTTTSVSFNIQRVVQSGGATVNPIRFHDQCGEWRTFVGGGSGAFSTP